MGGVGFVSDVGGMGDERTDTGSVSLAPALGRVLGSVLSSDETDAVSFLESSTRPEMRETCNCALSNC